ncbi:hypothetical protein HMPREF0322_02543 [Desulfitobacterium hafniense DP7]|uniref:Uncharacterized protein n=1 Tax=Desulfitobacterium hafniense DP7 TaxID=537010 RepID=G9XNK1_DESHA|nr:hypothetical protein HMPREF0322_02543 [Desulfitobacterium hafniense DP7]
MAQKAGEKCGRKGGGYQSQIRKRKIIPQKVSGIKTKRFKGGLLKCV